MRSLHKPMAYVFFAVLTVGVYSQSLSSSAHNVSLSNFDQYWQQAAIAWNAGESYKAGHMLIISNEIDKRGQISTSTVTELSLRYVGDQTITEVISSKKDGKDITAQTRAEYAKRDNDSGSGESSQMNTDDIIPFSSAVAAYLKMGVALTVNGGIHVPYEITKPKSGTSGVMYFSGAGLPQRLEYTMKPLPPLVSEFAGEISFEHLPSGVIVVSAMKFNAEGGVLLIRKRFSIQMEFSEYRKY